MDWHGVRSPPSQATAPFLATGWAWIERLLFGRVRQGAVEFRPHRAGRGLKRAFRCAVDASIVVSPATAGAWIETEVGGFVVKRGVSPSPPRWGVD